MSLKRKIILISVSVCLFARINQCSSERKLYISLERPNIDYSNPKFVTNVVFKSRRLSRNDPVHYVTLNITALVELDKGIKMEFFFYQLLSNMYKRSFVEWHINFCEFIENDNLIGSSLRAVYYKTNTNPLKCPMPPGNYSLKDMFISLSPLLYNFPFQDGRAYLNATRLQERVIEGHMDFQIKSFDAEKHTDKKKN